jgi:hypothetical protein
MDLRPKLADDFIEVILKDISLRRGFRQAWDSFDPDIQEEIKAGWKKAILKKFVSHSLSLSSGNWSGSNDQAMCLAFIEKYPRIQGLLDLAKAEANRLFNNPTFRLELNNDPETGHITSEGQSLSLKIQTHLDFDGPSGDYDETSAFWQADDAWLEWMCSDESPYYKLGRELGHTSDLFSVNLESKANGED